MIKVKNSQLDQEAIEAINGLIELDISALAAFKLVRVVKQLDEIVKAKTQSEISLVQKFAKKDDDGNIIEGKDESGNAIPNTYEITNVAEFNTEMVELMNHENDVEYEKISFEDLKLETAKVKDLLKLEFLFA